MASAPTPPRRSRSRYRATLTVLLCRCASVTRGREPFRPQWSCRPVQRDGQRWQHDPGRGNRDHLCGGYNGLRCSVRCHRGRAQRNRRQSCRAGYLTVFPSGATQPLASNLNYTVAEVVPNLVEVGIGSDGEVSIYSSAQSNVVVDLEGYVAPNAPGGLGRGSTTPCRPRPASVTPERATPRV